MASLFTKIIDGQIPGRFVWQDDQCVAFLTIEPLTPGHTLVVPRDEVEVWTDLSPQLMGHLTSVAQTIGRAQRAEWDSPFVGLLIAGFDIPHVHLHVMPTWTAADMNFRNADANPTAEAMDDAAQRLRNRLRDQGAADAVPVD
ncbi:diadenosine tetraphosphate (Ap4A) HIT family hydrolase [Kineosphaera limosa]|uniref:HIT family protein n=1 Tax=Kineosphaera limosa NBRC 100340 TaxID=1184609 RepID=K6WLQ2_9MICO|nr:HIT family protein [Kineosphaera limosa]NYD98938.1 diadenosine tetraphosphate (Ap4A) HIT family hydrolase [Kineosphaera limosa]GAB94736.1 HIT family protein [Kineosphaera limosa NBRC 100340]